MSNSVRPTIILLVEDSPTDQLMTRAALQRSRVPNELHVVNDGVEAMEFLRQQGNFANAPRPDLVLLDLNMPRMNGREVLNAVKSDPALKTIPVIVLTTSDAQEDVMISYGSYANSYLVKPVGFEAFDSLIQGLASFWLQVAMRPPNNNTPAQS